SPVVQTRQSAVCGDTRAPVGGPSSSTTAGTASAAASAAAATTELFLGLRLSQRPRDTSMMWWDAFACEFFDDAATVQVSFALPEDQAPRLYSYGRSLIPRFFHSLLRNCDEAFVAPALLPGGLVSAAAQAASSWPAAASFSPADCDESVCRACDHLLPLPARHILTEISLIIEFFLDDMRIHLWSMEVKQHRELVPRCVLTAAPAADAAVKSPMTRVGLSNELVNFSRLAVILQPMQELMTLQKQLGQPPRQCLQSALYHKWQKSCAAGNGVDPASGVSAASSSGCPTSATATSTAANGGSTANSATGGAAPASKAKPKKKRKAADSGAAATGGGGGRGGGGKKSTAKGAAATAAAASASGPGSNDVMVVLEPSLMGGVGGGGGGGGGGCGYGPPPPMGPGGGGSNSAAAAAARSGGSSSCGSRSSRGRREVHHPAGER
uniref:LID domain-containing protein n=1 Tax=Macrostomum lignano TaxID=282301 RepID=A0A1I8F1R1_9PLAT